MANKTIKVPVTGCPSREAMDELTRLCIDDHSIACFMHPKLRKAIEKLHKADEAYQAAEAELYGVFEELEPGLMPTEE